MAIDITPIIIAGQSNSGRNNSDVDIIAENGYAYNFNIQTEVLTDINFSHKKSTILQGFIKENYARGINTKYCVGQVAFGGTPLLPNINVGEEDWSPTGTLRIQAVDYINDMVTALQNAGFNVVKIIVVWCQGEQDAGYVGNGDYTQQEHYDAQPILFDYFKSNANVDEIIISKLGALTTDIDSPGWPEIRANQDGIAAERNDVTIGFSEAKQFINRNDGMADTIHYTEISDDRIGREISYAVVAEEPIYRETKYTEVLTLPNTVGYYKFPGDGSNEITNKLPAMSFFGSANANNLSTLITSNGEEKMFESTDNTGYATLSPSPIAPVGYNEFALPFWLYIDEDWDEGNVILISDAEPAPAKAGIELRIVGRLLQFEFKEANGNSTHSGSTNMATLKGQWVNVVPRYDGFNKILTLNGVEEINVEDKFDPSSIDMFIGVNSALGGGSNTGLKIDMLRIADRFADDSYISPLLLEPGEYNTENTPVTPDAPVITNEDNDTNTIILTHTGDLEVRIKDGDWNDTTSPYQVDYTIYNRYEIGEIEFRVKAEGVNPASDIVSNSIVFTECDQVDYTDVVYCSNDLNGIDTTSIAVKLWSKIVQYKSNVVIRTEDLTFTPDSETGKVVMSLPDTESMVGDHEYRFDFGNNAWYFAQVPKSDTPIVFWDLNPTKNEG